MTATTMPHEFTNVDLFDGKVGTSGTTVIDGPLLTWTANESEKSIVVDANSIQSLEWTEMPSGFELAIFRKKNTLIRLQGLTENALQSAQEFGVLGGVEVEEVAVSTKGWNWGECDLNDDNVQFVVDGDPAFSVPYAEISQAVKQGKRDLALELHQDDTARPDDECLVEMRFSVAPEALKDDDDDRDENMRIASSLDAMYNAISQKTKESGVQAESIASFSDVTLMSPRGRFELELFPSFLKLHGKSSSYKILYKSITRLFMLTAPDSHINFVISLDPPIRQGNTTYSFLILKFVDDEEIELKPNLEKSVLEEKYAGHLDEEMEGPTYDIVGRVFRALTQKKLVAPGSFRSHEENTSVHCSLKANDGMLFLLEKSFFFIYKPTMYLRFDSIASIEFARLENQSGGLSRSFDLVVNMRQGNAHHIFTGIEKDEYTPLFEFLRTKKITIINAKPELSEQNVEESYSRHGRRRRTVIKHQEEVVDDSDNDDSEDDEDFKGSADESDEDSDEYEERSQASGSDHKFDSDENKDDDEDDDDGDDDDDEHDDDDDDDDESRDIPRKKKKKTSSSSKNSSTKRERNNESDNANLDKLSKVQKSSSSKSTTKTASS